MKKYLAPQMTAISFMQQDVILSSFTQTDEGLGDSINYPGFGLDI